MARPERFELPTLCFEGRCSIQLSYGRVACIDSKSFIASTSIILKALTLYRQGRRSIPTELHANGATVVSSCSSTELFNGSNADSRSIQSNWGFWGTEFQPPNRSAWSKYWRNSRCLGSAHRRAKPSIRGSHQHVRTHCAVLALKVSMTVIFCKVCTTKLFHSRSSLDHFNR